MLDTVSKETIADYYVADISLAEWGHKEIAMANLNL